MRRARLNWPPISLLASNRVTLCPRSARVEAAAMPAGPAPTTAIDFAAAALVTIHSVSLQANGLTRHEDILPAKIWSRQAWLQAMQVLISHGRSSAALLTSSGSARKGRAIDTMSAPPWARIASAWAGSLMRLVATSGMVTCPFILAVTQAKAPPGTIVAMVGM